MPIPDANAIFRCQLTAEQLAADLAPLGRELADACEAAVPRSSEAPNAARLALETAYALAIKLVRARVGLELAGTTSFALLARGEDDALREWFRSLEANCPLEPDPRYSWYVANWTPGIASALRAVLARLEGYDGRAPLEAPHGRGDLFRALYQEMFPAACRHAMGEYYTPRWLAQAVLAELPRTSGWRGLDPCCGSGTFVVELIDVVLAETVGLPRERRLAEVLARVHGRDVNPLAVLTARANYWLAIAPLL
ncbi:MAG TPA: N-6 DNA methylase, partial [Oscillatoriaceae cyanobacterium]